MPTGPKPWVPKLRHFQLAYELKSRGAFKTDVAKRLKISLKILRHWWPDFELFFKHRDKIVSTVKFGAMPDSSYHLQNIPLNEIPGPLRPKPKKRRPPPPEGGYKKGRPMGTKKLNIKDIDLEKVRMAIVAGFKEDDVAAMLKISRGTLANYRKQWPELDHVIKTSRLEVTAEVVGATVKRAKGYKYRKTHVLLNPKSGKVVTKSVDEHVPGSVQAQKLVLANTNNWGSEPQHKAIDNKGAIIELLDKLAS